MGRDPNVKSRPASPAALREAAHPGGSDGEAKQPYATELDQYHGEKINRPKEGPMSPDE